MTRDARRWLRRSKRDMKKQDDKAWEGRGGQISPEGLLNNWKRIAKKRVREAGWVTLTRSSNHPCETQSALLCLGNSVEFVVKVVNVNLGIQTNLPCVVRALLVFSLSLSLSRTNPFRPFSVAARTRATLLRKCWIMFANPLVVHTTHFVPLSPPLSFRVYVCTSLASYNYSREETSAT